MLIHAVGIGSRKQAELLVATDQDATGGAAAKYRRQSFYLLLPFVTPIAELLARNRSGR